MDEGRAHNTGSMTDVLNAPHDEVLRTAHLELFTTANAVDIRVACWCSIGADHVYPDWVAAGRPSTRI